MVKAEKVSFSFPDKELYKNISFTIEDGQHAVLIGSNGTGKTTLIQMIMDKELYLYDGKIKVDETGRVGYVSQFVKHEKAQSVTVFDYLSEDFLEVQARIDALCDEMGVAEDLDAIYEEYQKVFDEFQSVDGDNYEANIHRQLKTAGLISIESLSLDKLSGGEFKLLQVIRQMLKCPGLLIMDEPDVFLDFENLTGLRDLINGYKGTMIVITHNRYLLNHCFNKILHLENSDLQEFDGSYTDYQYALLQSKIEIQEAAAADLEEIARQQKIVERMRAAATYIDSATKGRTLKARVSILERLEARQIKAPFVDIPQPAIHLPDLGDEAVADADAEMTKTDTPACLLKVTDYSLAFDKQLLSEVNFEILAGEKVALVGPNGTGKTTFLRDIYKNNDPSIQISKEAEIGFLSQLYGEMLDEDKSIFQTFEALGFEKREDVAAYVKDFCFEAESLDKKIGVLSGGEKNLLQLAIISTTKANLLLLDEPTSHLDTYAQVALEKALASYKGAVLMVSHDFYSIADTVDYVLLVADETVRKMSRRAFRKLIYKHHFDQDYLDLEQRKKELEMRVNAMLKAGNVDKAKDACAILGEVIAKMKRR